MVSTCLGWGSEGQDLGLEMSRFSLVWDKSAVWGLPTNAASIIWGWGRRMERKAVREAGMMYGAKDPDRPSSAPC